MMGNSVLQKQPNFVCYVCMIVKGFIGKYSSDFQYVLLHPELLASYAERYIKVYNEDGFRFSFFVTPIENLISMFYGYENAKMEYFTSLSIYNIKNLLERQSKLTRKSTGNSIIVIRNVNNFTSINTNNNHKSGIRIITKFSFLAPYRKMLSYQESTVEFERVYLNHLYSNFKILQNDFIGKKYRTDLVPKHLHFLSKSIKLLYNEGYSKFRAIVPQVASEEEVEMLLRSYKSFYLECRLVKNKKKVYIKYSFPNDTFRDYVIGVIRALLYLKHRKLSIFEFCKEIHISENFDIENTEYLRYNLIFDMYNHTGSKSYLSHLFVLCIYYSNIVVVVDNEGNSYEKSVLQIIVPFDKARKYKLYENNSLYDKTLIRWFINQIIIDSVIIWETMEEGNVFIIVK